MPTLKGEPTDTTIRKKTTSVISTVFLFLVGLLVLLSLVVSSLVKLGYIGKIELPQDRISRLTSTLFEATRLIDEIQKEIESRSALVSKLQNDIETYNQVVKLKQPEVEAVAQLLRGEIEHERKYALLQEFSLHFSFFVLGILTAHLFEKFRRRRELRREETKIPPPGA